MPEVTPIRNSKGDVESLIDADDNPRNKAFISTLAKTGIRISEATELKTSDIDFHRGILFTYSQYTKFSLPGAGVSCIEKLTPGSTIIAPIAILYHPQ